VGASRLRVKYIIRESKTSLKIRKEYFVIWGVIFIQGVSGGIVNILEGGSMDYSE